MAFNYKYPSRDEYNTDEEYEEAVRLYEWAEDQYIDEYEERSRDYDK